MKKYILFSTIFLFTFFVSIKSSAQIDVNNFDLKDLIGKVMNVEHGFAPKFSLGNISIPKIHKVAQILGMKKNPEVNRLFSTFNTGRTIYKIVANGGAIVAVYGLAKKLGDSTSRSNYKGALVGGLTSIASGLLVKFLTKGAAYKAVDVFNGIAMKKIRDIFSVKPASNTMGIGLYVKLD